MRMPSKPRRFLRVPTTKVVEPRVTEAGRAGRHSFPIPPGASARPRSIMRGGAYRFFTSSARS
jgi:hypothetical protein